MEGTDEIEKFLRDTREGQELLHRIIPGELPYWLTTDAGQDWLAKLAEDTGVARVLVVMNGDGYVESYTQGRVVVKFIEVACERKAAGGKVHLGCRRYALRELPAVWRRVWETGKRGRTFFFRGLRLADLVLREVNHMALRAIKELGK